MSNDNIPPELRNMLRRYDQRLKEIERRLTGLGSGTAVPGSLASVDWLYSGYQDLAVASGAFPVVPGTDIFTPERDSRLAIGLLYTIMQPPDVAGTFDAGAAVEIEGPAGIWNTIAETGGRLPSSPTPNTSYNFGSWGAVPIFGGFHVGETYNIRHAYYYPDIGGLGFSAVFVTRFILLAFALIE